MTARTSPTRSATATDGPLLRDAVHVLIDNWHGQLEGAVAPASTRTSGAGTRPSSRSACRTGAARAETELLRLFGAQWANGMVPHIVFNPAVDPDAYFPRSDLLAVSGGGRPPAHRHVRHHPATGARHRGGGGGRRGSARTALAFARRAYPRLVAQHDYLRRRRSVGPAGLAAAVHPWETGMDNSPAWDTPLHAVPADLALFDTYTRRDLEHAGTAERPTDEDYARYIRLALAYRDHGYDDDWVRAEGEFCVVDPTFNALWAWAEVALADLASPVGARHRRGIGREAARLTQGLVDQLWRAADGIFVARDIRPGRLTGGPDGLRRDPARILPDLPATGGHGAARHPG